MRFVLAGLIALTFCLARWSHAQPPGQDTIWLEGEAPIATNVKPNLAGWGNKQFLSSEKWLHLSIDADKVDKELPAEGALLRYDFAIKSQHDHEIWARIGFEFARSPFDWRLDDGNWATISPDALTSDLMEIDFFCEVAWLKLGKANLAPGTHRLELRLNKLRDDKGKPQRVLFALDAICVDPGAFRPNGKFKPDDSGRDDHDRQAARTVFQLLEPGQAGTRESMALAGQWEICRDDEQQPGPVAVPIPALPQNPVWRAIAVPGDKNTLRPDLVFAHRVWYRTRVEVPATAVGRSFFLVFPQNNLNTTVYVNGVYCGFDKNPFAKVQIDVTKGIKPGQNEVWVGIRDAWYGYSASASDPMKLRRKWNLPKKFFGDGFQDLAYPIWNHPESGILETPLLFAVGPAYVADVFIKPSVAKKELAVDVTLSNPTGQPVDGELIWEVVDRTGEFVRSFRPRAIALGPGKTTTVALAEPWASPFLWWPDNPWLYRLRTTLKSGGRTLDVSETLFGFREWTIAGKDFRLNGVPWHGWADTHDQPTPQEWLDFYRQTNQTFMRLWGTRWMGLAPQDALDFFDKRGVVVRRSGMLDGEAIGYMAIENDPELKKQYGSEIKMELMENWRDQMIAQVKGERNHPSIMIWSIENEWLYINCINLYGHLMDRFEDEVVKVSHAVREVDPTRPAMTDGGGATTSNRMPVHGDHYTAGPFSEYPTLAYEPNAKGGGRGRWEWDLKRPRFIGEELFAAGHNPAYAYFGGEEVFVGQQSARRAVGIAVRMMTEGARWNGYGAIHFWQTQDAATGQYAANAPRAVFSRQWDWTFGAEQTVDRTYGIFNDTHDDSPITFTRSLKFGGREMRRRKTQHNVPPGESLVLHDPLALTLPAGLENSPRIEGELVLSLHTRSGEVFREVKEVSVLNLAPKLPGLAQLAASDLAVYDPAGDVGRLLESRTIEYTKLADLKTLPASAKVVLIGRDALSADESASTRLAAYALEGKRVIVLEQTEPLRYQALASAEMETASNRGRTAFIEDATHPLVRGLKQKDFFTWQPGEVVYRNAYLKPARGARSIVQCHDKLAHTALAEVPVGTGLLLLCQLRVGETLATNVVAQRLLLNLLEHAATYRQEFRPVATVVEGAPGLASALDRIGLRSTSHSDPLQAMAAPGVKIAVIAATPARLKALVEAKGRVEAFLAAGGYVLLNGLTPEGLDSFNALVGVDHMIRPFARERVTLPAVKDPLMAGLTSADVVMYSSERIFPWQEGNYVSSEIFTFVVDVDDVAPFARFENDFLRNMVNGMVSADGWKYIVNVPAPAQPPLDFKLVFPRPQEIAGVEWIGNTFYYPVTWFALLFDGKGNDKSSFPVTPNNEPQTFAIDPPLTGREITLRLDEWQVIPGKAQVTGLDNIRLFAKRPPGFSEKVRPMLNVGGLVHYPRGPGGIILCNLKFAEPDDAPENPEKKRAILAGVLRNLKAPFAGGRTIIAGAKLAYEPLDLSKQANQYRTDRGWFGDRTKSFAELPGGRRTLAGVPFVIHDFPTSPVPTVVMLGGSGVPGGLPDAVRGIPVNRKADALFFLQAARIDRRRDDKEVREHKAFELARYIVTYADGQTATVPIRSEIDVDDYRQRVLTPLPGAQIGWSRRYSDTDLYAVAYVQQWTNPRPLVEVKSIALVYPDGERRGVPALIAVTVAAGFP
jgi:hypothetical protein